jgi:hypothetical protein
VSPHGISASTCRIQRTARWCLISWRVFFGLLFMVEGPWFFFIGCPTHSRDCPMTSTNGYGTKVLRPSYDDIGVLFIQGCLRTRNAGPKRPQKTIWGLASLVRLFRPGGNSCCNGNNNMFSQVEALPRVACVVVPAHSLILTRRYQP